MGKGHSGPEGVSLPAPWDSEDVDAAVQACIAILDKPPPEYRVVKQAVQGLLHLAKRRDALRPVVMLRLLQVIKEPRTFRSNPRRFAVRSLGHLCYCDAQLVAPSVDLLLQMVTADNEPSQYVRKAAFCALSRIGRKYPTLNTALVDVFVQHYLDPHEKESVKWGALIGLGRLAQTSAQVRTNSFPLFVEACRSHSFRMRWAGIKGLGHACCSSGNVENDPVVEQACFEEAHAMLCLSHKGEPLEGGDCRQEQVYLVQYGAMQALGLLLRSNADVWWPRLAASFAQVLRNGRYAAMVKASVMLSLGKAAYFMDLSNPYLKAVQAVLFELSRNDNLLVAEPACYALANIALAHRSLVPDVRALLRDKVRGRPLVESQTYFLKTWCKFVSMDYVPVLAECKDVVSLHPHETVARQDVTPAAPQETQGQGGEQWLLEQLSLPPSVVRQLRAMNAQESEPDRQTEASDQAAAEQRQRCSRQQLLQTCTRYSATVLESVLLLTSSVSLLDNAAFVSNLQRLLQEYNSKGDVDADQTGFVSICQRLERLHPFLLDTALAMMRVPELLSSPLWLSNVKQIAASLPPPTVTALPPGAPPPATAPPQPQPQPQRQTTAGAHPSVPPSVPASAPPSAPADPRLRRRQEEEGAREAGRRGSDDWRRGSAEAQRGAGRRPREEHQWQPAPAPLSPRKRRRRSGDTVCRFYGEGYCKRGMQCPYSHELSEEVYAGRQPARLVTIAEAAPGPAPAEPRVYFVEPPVSYSAERGEERGSDAAPVVQFSPVKKPRNPQYRRECRDYLHGVCPQGKDCSNVHTDRSNECAAHLHGGCPRGAACTQDHPAREPCRFYLRRGWCGRRDCPFLHPAQNSGAARPPPAKRARAPDHGWAGGQEAPPRTRERERDMDWEEWRRGAERPPRHARP